MSNKPSLLFDTRKPGGRIRTILAIVVVLAFVIPISAGSVVTPLWLVHHLLDWHWWVSLLWG